MRIKMVTDNIDLYINLENDEDIIDSDETGLNNFK